MTSTSTSPLSRSRGSRLAAAGLMFLSVAGFTLAAAPAHAAELTQVTITVVTSHGETLPCLIGTPGCIPDDLPPCDPDGPVTPIGEGVPCTPTGDLPPCDSDILTTPETPTNCIPGDLPPCDSDILTTPETPTNCIPGDLPPCDSDILTTPETPTNCIPGDLPPCDSDILTTPETPTNCIPGDLPPCDPDALPTTPENALPCTPSGDLPPCEVTVIGHAVPCTPVDDTVPEVEADLPTLAIPPAPSAVVLAATGGDPDPKLAVLGLLFLVAGIAAVGTAKRRELTR